MDAKDFATFAVCSDQDILSCSLVFRKVVLKLSSFDVVTDTALGWANKRFPIIRCMTIALHLSGCGANNRGLCVRETEVEEQIII